MWSKNLALRANYFRFAKKICRNTSQSAPAAETSNYNVGSDVHNLMVGDKIHGFEVKDIREVSEFKVTAILLEHHKTKTEYLHLFRNDNNNVFSINFRTTPMNSTGLPHILEHTVLCGSELYPVRDPFFKMLTRSLATFMNAMTGSDFTIYPFSTQNISDYRNLQKIYLDAVFRPNLKEFDFMQEGWRLENKEVDNMKSPLIIKGVVYNEMKGAFSENESLLSQKLQNMILPDHTYGVVSGGDPMKIPDLTWDDLKNFHKNHYHPSNAKIYSYGNFPLKPTLDYLDSEYFSKYSYHPPDHTAVPSQKRWTEAKQAHIEGRFENMRDKIEKQNTIVISLVMSDITDIYETFVLQFVTELLIRGPNSPFYKSLIEPNFSGGYTLSTGYDTQTRDSIFTVGLQGIKKSDFDKVVTLFDKTVEKVVEKGFDKKHIEAVLHRYEISIKHETQNFGLNLLFGVTPIWNHSGQVVTALQVNKMIEKLNEEMTNDSQYLKNIVKNRIKDNKHRLTLTMSPDKDYEKKQALLEEKLIHAKSSKLGESDRKQIFSKNLDLQREQSTLQSNELLPSLKIDDVSNDVERVPTDRIQVGHVVTQINKVYTNGIVYFKGVLNSMNLSPEQQMLLPLFCYVINKLGTDKLNYKEFDSLVNRKTAGLDFNVFIGESLYQLHSYEPGVVISSYCLEKNLKDMWELWTQLFTLSQLTDVARFKMLVHLYMSDLTQGVADSGHLYAMQAASALVSGSAYQKELLTGLQHISYMKRLMHISNFPAMLRELTAIGHALFNVRNLRCALNISEENAPAIVESYKKFINQLPDNPNYLASENTYLTGKVLPTSDAVHCQHHILNVPINFCSKAVLTAPYTTTDYAKLRVLARLLSSKHLHPELREKNGAYGGGARLSTDGVFTFYSYRDPRSLETLDVFDNSHTWFQEELNKITPQEIIEAKLGVFQSIDAPIPPSGKGNDEFLRRLTPDVLQIHRAEVMIVDQNGLKDAAEKYLSKESATLTSKVIVGPKTEWDTTNRSDELWTVVESV